MQRHLARSDARRKQPQVFRTSGLDNELRHCVVREQHAFAASTQSIVHGLHAKLSSICVSICVFIICPFVYLFIHHISPYLSIHPSVYLFVCLSISQNGKMKDMCKDIWHVPTRDNQCSARFLNGFLERPKASPSNTLTTTRESIFLPLNHSRVLVI